MFDEMFGDHKPLFTFDDIIVPDVDDLLGPSDQIIEEPEDDPRRPVGSAWDSGKKENLWRSVEPKDIWTAENDTDNKEPWVSDGNDDSEGNQEANNGGMFGDIL